MFLGPRTESGLAVVLGSREFKDWFSRLLAVELLDKPFSLIDGLPSRIISVPC